MVFFSVMFFLASFLQILAGKRCVDHRSEYGFALVDHVYHSFTADRLSTCYIACNMQPACQSLNYDLADKTCQFNNNTKHFRPKYFVEKATSVYADNPDSDNVILLPESQEFKYTLPGQNADSKEIEFTDISIPLLLSSGQELRIWYGEDLANYGEGDNDGTSCVDVYAN
ncbi:uncharacterized protein LOC144641399 [Oculina patagonica]